MSALVQVVAFVLLESVSEMTFCAVARLLGVIFVPAAGEEQQRTVGCRLLFGVLALMGIGWVMVGSIISGL